MSAHAAQRQASLFQPLHLIWEGKIVDAIFRRGDISQENTCESVLGSSLFSLSLSA